MKGDTISSPQPVWGTQGIGEPANTPAAKYSYYHWQDSTGNFWVYSGVSFSYGNVDGFDDVWKFDVASQNWIWMRGSTTIDPLAVFGTQGIPSPDNTPGFRYFGSLSWTGKDGKFWLFSGEGGGDDMWMYDPSINEWTWMSGSGNGYYPHYGTMQVASPDNTPGIIDETNASWVDDAGNLWFFGGIYGWIYSLDVLWKYDVSTLEWTWMNGDTIPDVLPVYGELGVPSPDNTPGARDCYSSWQEGEDFWLFGGASYYTFQSGPTERNDVWKYSTVTNEWTWMSGDSVGNNIASAGSYCEANVAFHPGARMENRSCCKDSCGNVWMFGGIGNDYYGYTSDLWVYRPAENDWSFIAGDLTLSQNSVFGVKGVPSPTNKPGARDGAISWFDHEGNFWLFGGHYFLNDLWRFTPDTSCPGAKCHVATAIADDHHEENYSVYPNPSSGIINIEISGSENVTIEIRNLFGVLVFSSDEKNIHPFAKQIDLSRSEASSGIYFITLKTEKEYRVKKVIITM